MAQHYTYISRQELAEMLRNRPDSVTVIDVRDDDHVGGHIKGSQNVPTSTLDWRLPELVRTLQARPNVVFHCMLSQIRGPKSARRYGEERERLLGGNKDAAAPPKQNIYVLSGGFEKWVEGGFGEDPLLTEGFAKDIWTLDE